MKVQYCPENILAITADDFFREYNKNPQNKFVKIAKPFMIIPVEGGEVKSEILPQKSIEKNEGLSFHSMLKVAPK